jgi:hypothetical protein
MQNTLDFAMLWASGQVESGTGGVQAAHGCILAHAMGLGKSLQVKSFLRPPATSSELFTPVSFFRFSG